MLFNGENATVYGAVARAFAREEARMPRSAAPRKKRAA